MPVQRFASYADLSRLQNARVFFASGDEDRSQAIDAWIRASDICEFISVVAPDDYSIGLTGSGTSHLLASRNLRQQSAYWTGVREDSIVIDITGLSHAIWAILLRGALASGKSVFVSYAEPKSYSRSDAPTEGQIYDLSVKIEGIRPIPGFATLSDSPERRVCVPLLGFEGTRFAHLINVLQPSVGRVIPIVGVPGFEIEYPFHTYRGNRVPLLDADAFGECRYAAANCPFSALYALQDIEASVDPELPIAVAPIGTKPHALGALLYYLTSARPIEIVYDHPIRRLGRSSGARTVSLYNLTGIVPPHSLI